MTAGQPIEMSSNKPYLLRALYEWILDNGQTPHVIVNVHAENVVVPDQAVKDGRLVLNIAPQATRNLSLENEAISFEARFAGVSREVYLPMDSVLAIYARENGQGMMFSPGQDEDAPPPADGPSRPEGGPKLRVIK